MFYLLSESNTKLNKSTEFGYLSAGLQLEPAYQLTEDTNTCPDRGVCAGFCISQTGHNRFDHAKAARLRRTHMFRDNPTLFFELLDCDIRHHARIASKELLIPTIRLNTLSDIPYENYRDMQGKNIFERHPNIKFLDYTKTMHRCRLGIPNYTVIYSVNEKTNYRALRNLLTHGGCASVVFNLKKGEELPSRFKVNGRYFPVDDGDINDLVHLSAPGTIQGLRYKQAFHRKTGKAVKPNSLFILEA
jgi:hypothetical protein